MSDRPPAYEGELDRLLHKHGLSSHLYDSTTAKMAYLLIALDREITTIRFPTG